MSFRVVIITCRSGSLRQAEHYLRNRQWDVYSTPSLRDAVTAVLKRRPDFVFVAADHPNRKVREMPLLIRRALDVKIIAFCESSSATAFAALNEMSLPYTVYPPVSGPAIERIALKIKKEEEQAKEQGPPLTLTRSDLSGSGYKTIEGARDQGATPSGPIIIKKDPQASNSFYINTGQERPGPGGGFIPGEGHGSDSGMIRQEANGDTPFAAREGSSPEGGDHWSDKGAQNPESEDASSPPASDPYASDWEADQRNEYEQNHSKRKGPTYEGGGRRFKPAVPNFGDSKAREKDDRTIVLEGRHIPKKPKDIPRYRQDPSKYPDKDSIMVRGTQQALEEAAIIGDLTEYEELQKSTNVACIIVESPRFSGYLVAAMGKDRRIDEKFTETVKEKLFDFLRAHGETVADDQNMNLTLEQVDFEEWAIQQAHFLRKAIHGSQEVAIAFFPTKETSVSLEESVSKSMLKMSLDELRDDVPVEFDIYIYMPSNNRFLLYTPEGRPIYGSQRGRLREKGVTHIHLRKENSPQVKKYRAQVFLNDRIAEFRARAQAKAS